MLGLSSSLKLFFCALLTRIKFYLFCYKTHFQLGPEAGRNGDAAPCMLPDDLVLI